MPNWDLCRDCPIDGKYEPTEANGNEDAPYLIVTDKPSTKCAQERVALAPGHNRMLMKHMNQSAELEQDDFRYVPMCLCPYNNDDHTNKEKKAIHLHCRPHLEDYIAETKPEAIIPLGGEATSAVFGRAVQITKVRGLGHQSIEFGVPVFPLLSPILACRYEQNEPILAADCASFGRLVDSDLDTKKADSFTTGTYKRVYDLQHLIDEDAELIAFDLEGTGLRWYQGGCDVRTYKPKFKGDPNFKPRAQILTMQFTTKAGESHVLVWDHPEDPIAEWRKPKLRNQIRQLLCKEDRIVVGQHLKHDAVWLLQCEGIRFRVGGDTQMLAAIHNENLPEKNLDVLTKIFVPDMAGYADRFNSVVDKSRMWEVPIETIIPYGGGDTDASFRLYDVLEGLVMEDEGNWNHYARVSIPGMNSFVSMETTGMYIDEDEALPEFQTYLTAEVKKQKAALLKQVPKSIKREHLAMPSMRNKDPEDVLSFSRSAFVKDILFTHKDGFKLTPKVFTKTTAKLNDASKREPSTSSKDHLPYFFDTVPFTSELATYVKDERLLSTNIVGFQEKFMVGGKVRPNYSLAKTVTRRTSSNDPNGQNFPKRGEKAKKYQRIFKAPEGYYVISRDLSQAELRIAGEMAADPVITRIYQNDGDIHISTACIVMNKTEAQFKLLPKSEQKDGRQKAKAVNFGFIYGMGWRKFIGYAKTQYGVTFTEAEAKRIRNAYFTKYKGLKEWHDNTRKYVMKYGYVRSFSGLVRHLPMVNSPDEGIQQEAVRQAINSPVQEFGSTLGVCALGRMNEEVDSKYLEVIGFIHDAIYAYVKKEHLEWGLKTLGYYMESTPLEEWFGLDMRIPIVSDPSFGVNMGDQFELKDFPRSQKEKYDWGHACLREKELESGELLIDVPRQKIPPNNGRLTRSVYTLPTDLEPELRDPNASRRIKRTTAPKAQASKRITRTRPTPAPAPATSKRIKRTRA